MHIYTRCYLQHFYSQIDKIGNNLLARLGSLYSHALLIPTESSKFTNQVVHEQKFVKDLLSSTCQVSVERIVLDLESEAMRGPGSIPTEVQR